MKNNILFVNEKFTDGNPSIGLSNSFHNLFNSFQQTQPDYNLITLHLDEAESIYGVHLDSILPNFCKAHNIKIINFCLMNGAKGNPSINCFRELKSLGIYLIFHWPDFGNSFGSQTLKELDEVVDLSVSWDNSPVNPNNNKHLKLFVPQDSNLYFKDNQTIPVSFMGSTKGYFDRPLLLNYLKANFPNIYVGGGQREQSLSPYTYAKIIRTSKIGINFSTSQALFSQTKGRVYEILASGSMLFEMNNESTALLFRNGIDYVSFNSPKDMLEKLYYYLNHDEERKKIAEQGYETYNKNYTSQIFWDTIIARFNKDLGEKRS